MSLFVDGHCHIDCFDDPLTVLAAAERANVWTVFVTELPSRFRPLATQLHGAKRVRVALGSIPLAVARDVVRELALFARFAAHRFVGEVGLDFSERGRDNASHQPSVFERILALSAIRRKVLSVHSRRAEKETICCPRSTQRRFPPLVLGAAQAHARGRIVLLG